MMQRLARIETLRLCYETNLLPKMVPAPSDRVRRDLLRVGVAGLDSAARKADLRLDTSEDGDDYDGAYLAIEPGDPDASELIARIDSDDADLVMPPPTMKNRLTAAEKALLFRWVEEGAKYEPHWSFTPIIKHAPPELLDDGWSRNGLDRFVYARLKGQGISPSPEANRVTWLRRVTQDVTGLPPTIKAIDAFLADPSPESYEKVVDRLLASDDYAERMTKPFSRAAC